MKTLNVAAQPTCSYCSNAISVLDEWCSHPTEDDGEYWHCSQKCCGAGREDPWHEAPKLPRNKLWLTGFQQDTSSKGKP